MAITKNSNTKSKRLSAQSLRQRALLKKLIKMNPKQLRITFKIILDKMTKNDKTLIALNQKVKSLEEKFTSINKQ